MTGTQEPTIISTKRPRIAQLAQRKPEVALNTLSHHIDLEWMREAYRRTRKSGATGVDGQTAEQYAINLDGNLSSLLDRAKSKGRYRAPPVRRAFIPKDNGEMRPLGIPTFEDKVLQRAVSMVLESVYEQDFLPCSYGFRPGRSAIQAVHALNGVVWRTRECTVIEMDFRKFFDSVDHKKLQVILRERIGDGNILRLVGKWLNAGVLEDGRHLRFDAGTPQGGVISPLLANIYLHTVLDLWFEKDVRPRMRGASDLIRFADDAVMVFENHRDAERVMAVLAKRVEKFGLELHPDKTRMVRFDRPSRNLERNRDRSGTFDFLGFTFYWGTSRRGAWMPKQKTSSQRLRRSLKAANQWMKEARCWKISKQFDVIKKKLIGHYRYFGIGGNFGQLSLTVGVSSDCGLSGCLDGHNAAILRPSFFRSTTTISAQLFHPYS